MYSMYLVMSHRLFAPRQAQNLARALEVARYEAAESRWGYSVVILMSGSLKSFGHVPADLPESWLEAGFWWDDNGGLAYDPLSFGHYLNARAKRGPFLEEEWDESCAQASDDEEERWRPADPD